jgi:hypothetical protein
MVFSRPGGSLPIEGREGIKPATLQQSALMLKVEFSKIYYKLTNLSLEQ